MEQQQQREQPVGVAIIGSGNIGTDLMIKVLRHGKRLRMAALAGIDPASEGLAFARRHNVATTHDGIDGLLALPEFAQVRIAFDATSAGAHARHDRLLRERGVKVVDLTPAALGPFTVPVVNADANLGHDNINMVTCGGQATIPIVAAVSAVTPVYYAEIVASIASKSAGPGTRANIDEFTETTSHAIEAVGGARRGKAIIVLNPAEPPLLMRNTVYCLTGPCDTAAVERSIEAMVERVKRYVPGYRLKQRVQVEPIAPGTPLPVDGYDASRGGVKFSVFLQVEGAAHYLPAYAGNLDIMTSAAVAAAERIAGSLPAHPAVSLEVSP